jgi:hypothetical protein
MEVDSYGNIVNPIRRIYLISKNEKRNLVYHNYSHKKGESKYDERGFFETGNLIDIVA